MSKQLSVILLLIILIGILLYYSSGKKEADSSPISSIKQSAVTEPVYPPPEFEKWREFSPSEGQFRVLLPSLPQHVKDKIEDPVTKEPRKYDAYVTVTTEVGQSVFMISAIELPKELQQGKEAEDTLKAMVDQLLSKDPSNHLESIANGKFRNLTAIDFAMSNKNGRVAGKAFAKGPTLYILTMGNSQYLYNPDVLNFFINSFQIVAKGAGSKMDQDKEHKEASSKMDQDKEQKGQK